MDCFGRINLTRQNFSIKMLDKKPWTTCFLDGNHENHTRLDNLPIIEKWCGKVGQVSESIFHLKRGEIYTFDNKKYFVFGGADSIDKGMRMPLRSWWPREIYSREEENTAFDNLEKHQWNVDYILAHTVPEFLTLKGGPLYNEYYWNSDPTRKLLEHIVYATSFKRFFAGHFHENINFKWNDNKEFHVLDHLGSGFLIL